MARTTNRLSAVAVRTMKTPGLHADGAGLYLSISKTGSKSWRLIYRFGGKRCEHGLGALGTTSLAQARDKCAAAKVLLVDGVDPKVGRQVITSAANPTFGTVATELIDGLELGWKNPKHRAQWRSTLKVYALSIWDTDVSVIDVNDILKLLQPIWIGKPETARRVRGRIERVLTAAKVRGYRRGENPAAWPDNLKLLLPEQKDKVKHHAAMPFEIVPSFMVKLRARPAMAARALEFTILTAARTSETLLATWSEIDLNAKLWTVAAERMKAGKVHRVPLNEPAVKLVQALADEYGSDGDAYVFPSARPDQPLSGMGMTMLMRRMELTGVTTHGFRSSFRDWVGEKTSYSFEVAEAALAHEVGNAVSRAYRRGDSLDQRREMMTAWSNYLSGPA